MPTTNHTGKGTMRTQMRLVRLAAAALTVALLAAPAAAEKYALLCGCAVYDQGPHLKPPDLRTTVNDVLSLYETLVQRFAFKPANIRVLLSPPELWPLQPPPAGPATTAAIAESFADWFAQAGPDDLIFFGYSGHGTFLHYTGGGADVHEEALLGSDYARTDPPQALTFSQLRWLHSRLRDGQSVFVVDACHAGGGSLALDVLLSPFGASPAIRYSGTEPETRPVETPALAAAGASPQIAPEALAAIQRRTVTVTACQSWEAASGVGPELSLLGQPRQTGVLTGSLVRAMGAGPANQSWEDLARTARFLSVLGCIGQTVNIHGQGLASMPFSQPAAAPGGLPYYLAVPQDGAFAVPADPFLAAGSALAVYGGPTPEGDATAPGARLEAPSARDAAMARLLGVPAADGPRAAVARVQSTALPPLGIFAQAADALGADQPAESEALRTQLARTPYVRMCPSARDPAADYRLWITIEEEDATRPFARARSADFPSRQVQGKPARRPFAASAQWLHDALHYLRAVQGAAWLRNHAAPFRVTVTPDQARPLYPPGATVRLTVEASAACHVVVVLADSAGRLLAAPLQAVSPGQPGEAAFTLPASGAAHDLRLVVVKAFAFVQRPDDAALAKLTADGATDPARAMLGLLQTALGVSGTEGIPTDGWADNEAFVAVWDRTPLTAPVEF